VTSQRVQQPGDQGGGRGRHVAPAFSSNSRA
jgi:hypothetical protein